MKKYLDVEFNFQSIIPLMKIFSKKLYRGSWGSDAKIKLVSKSRKGLCSKIDREKLGTYFVLF